jgi:two-component system, sensor histidine kinase
MNEAATISPARVLRPVPVALLGAAVAVAANLLAPPLVLGHTLVLGSAAYWVVLALAGPNVAVPVLLAGFGMLVMRWGEPFSAGLILLEALVVGAAWRRRWNPFLADLAFWAVAGLPAAWFVFSRLLNLSQPSLGIATALQPLNGLISVWVAHVAIRLIVPRQPEYLGRPGRAGVLAFLARRYIAFGTVPLAVAAQFVAFRSERNLEAQTRSELARAAAGTAEAVRVFLDESVAVIEHAALRKVAREDLAPWMLEAELAGLHAAHPRFITLLGADASGHVIAAAPETARRRAREAPFSVADRAYFRIPRETRRPYVSQVLRGRGFGSDLIVAVSAPLFDRQGDWLGVIEGSLAIQSISGILGDIGPADSWQVLVTDASGQVVQAIGLDGMRPLDRLGGTRLHEQVAAADGKVRRLVMSGGERRESVLSVSVPVSRYGWRVTLQRPISAFIWPVVETYLAILGIGALTALAAAAFVTLAGRDLTTALDRILAYSRGQPATVLEGLNRETLPREMDELITNLRSLSERAEGERRRREELLLGLEDQVAERTRELAGALDAAHAADRAKSAFVATVSHELRTPLTSIITAIRLLRHAPRRGEEATARTLETMERSSQVLLELISTVLDFSKIQAGAMGLDLRVFRPAELIAEVESIIRPRLDPARVRLELACDFPSTLPWRGDPQRIRQVLLNLLSNAVKFTPSGTVALQAWVAPEGHLCFTVADTGPGIPAESLERIFEPFVQLQPGRQPGNAGTGLGLFISRSLAQLMRGELAVRSEPGQGTCFTFWIPPAEERASDTV